MNIFEQITSFTALHGAALQQAIDTQDQHAASLHSAIDVACGEMHKAVSANHERVRSLLLSTRAAIAEGVVSNESGRQSIAEALGARDDQADEARLSLRPLYERDSETVLRDGPPREPHSAEGGLATAEAPSEAATKLKNRAHLAENRRILGRALKNTSIRLEDDAERVPANVGGGDD